MVDVTIVLSERNVSSPLLDAQRVRLYRIRQQSLVDTFRIRS